MSLIPTIQKTLLDPIHVFKTKELKEATPYLLTLLLINALITSILSAFFPALTTLGQTSLLLSSLPTVGVFFVFFIASYLGSLTLLVLWSVWIHLWMFLFGGKEAQFTIKTIFYSYTPILLFGWLGQINNPFFSVIAFLLVLWVILLQLWGLKTIHHLSMHKLALAYGLGVAIPLMVLFGLSLFLTLFTGPQAGATPF